MTYWQSKSVSEKNSLKRIDEIVSRRLEHEDRMDAHRKSKTKVKIGGVGMGKKKRSNNQTVCKV